eukprot:GHVT01059305.1.p1 GENE.GHVT01059305.1~~GHVT01059305.1.p1  ORF type:complete len:343 (+),score=87.22 GHVT01059305.1:1043-2071(+)
MQPQRPRDMAQSSSRPSPAVNQFEGAAPHDEDGGGGFLQAGLYTEIQLGAPQPAGAAAAAAHTGGRISLPLVQGDIDHSSLGVLPPSLNSSSSSSSSVAPTSGVCFGVSGSVSPSRVVVGPTGVTDLQRLPFSRSGPGSDFPAPRAGVSRGGDSCFSSGGSAFPPFFSEGYNTPTPSSASESGASIDYARRADGQGGERPASSAARGRKRIAAAVAAAAATARSAAGALTPRTDDRVASGTDAKPRPARRRRTFFTATTLMADICDHEIVFPWSDPNGCLANLVGTMRGLCWGWGWTQTPKAPLAYYARESLSAFMVALSEHRKKRRGMAWITADWACVEHL